MPVPDLFYAEEIRIEPYSEDAKKILENYKPETPMKLKLPNNPTIDMIKDSVQNNSVPKVINK